MQKPIISLSTSTVIVDWKSNKNIYYIVDCMGLSSTRFQLYCVDQVFVVVEETGLHGGKYHWPPSSYWPWGKIPLTTLKLLTMGKNTTDHPQVTDHGGKYHWPPSSYWPWGIIPLTSLKLLTMGKNTTDLPQVTDHGGKYHWPPSSYWQALSVVIDVALSYHCFWFIITVLSPSVRSSN